MTCICVLGMHRSGTSCLTGIMQGLGVELGEVYTANEHNPRGNRENDAIVVLNEELLNAAGGSWYEPVTVTSWTAEQAAQRDAIIADLSQRGSDYWGFKDTRTLFTLPFWLEALDTPRLIGTFRHPHRVALSLHKRDKTDVRFSWQLWRTYNLRLLDVAAEHGCELIDFDREPEAYLNTVIDKLVALGLDRDHAERGREFFDPQLRTQTDADISQQVLPDEIIDLYKRLRERAG